MSSNTFKARLKKVVSMADQVLNFEFELIEPREIEFKAGQFLMLHVPNEDGQTVKRAYSIASSPDDKWRVVFVIKFRDGGKASNYLQGLEIGSEVTMDGPLGRFYLQENDQDILFVATGTGIAPIRSMILKALGSGFKGDMWLFFGVREETDVFWKEEFEELAAKNENFKFVLTLSRPSGQWGGGRGRVTDHLKKFGVDATKTMAYLCGSMSMVNEVVSILAEKGLTNENIKKEIY